jgi:cystathionine gamma-synthase
VGDDETDGVTPGTLEDELAGLGEGPEGLAFVSVAAARDALLRATLRPGGHVVLPDDADAGTYLLVTGLFGPWGVECSTVHLADPDAVAAAVEPGRTSVVWVQLPADQAAEPDPEAVDLASVAAHARAAGAVLVVDLVSGADAETQADDAPRDSESGASATERAITLGADVVVRATPAHSAGGARAAGTIVVADGAQLPVGVQGPTGTTHLRDAVDAVRAAAGTAPGGDEPDDADGVDEANDKDEVDE